MSLWADLRVFLLQVTPQHCRLRDLTYAAPITVDVEYVRARQIVTRRVRLEEGLGGVMIDSGDGD